MNKVSKESLFNKVFFFLFFLIVGVYSFLITYGTGDFFGAESRGDAYDSLCKSILKGDCTVDEFAIREEGFLRDKKTYMCFSPFPSLIRIPLNLIFPFLYGHWTRISCLFASVFCLLAFAFIVHLVLLENKFLTKENKKVFFNLSLLAFGLGSPLFFLVSCGFIFHEAQLWAFCWSLWSIYFLLSFVFNSHKQYLNLFLFSFCSGAAFLSKVTFGFPLYIILALIVFNLFVQNFKQKTSSNIFSLIVAISPALIMLLFHLWYNFCRFHSVFIFMDCKYYFNYLLDPIHREVHKATGILNWNRLPYTILNYFLLVSPEFFSKHAPFIVLPNSLYGAPNLFTYRERPFPLILVSPWIFIGAALGLKWLFEKNKNVFSKLCVFIFLIQGVLISTFISVYHRYVVEYLPFMIFLYSFFLLKIGEQQNFKKNQDKIFLLGLILVMFSIITTILSTLSWVSNVYVSGAPEHYQQTLKTIFRSIDAFLG